MNIIDWENKGNIVRLYLGANGKQWGDDWNDAPYECNAGRVYSEFVKSTKDISFPFDTILLFPDDCQDNSLNYTKEMMRDRKIPFMISLTEEAIMENDYETRFKYWIDKDCSGCHKYYFGDTP